MGPLNDAFDQLREWVDSGAVPGVAAVVLRRGELVARFVAGLARRAPEPVPVTADTVFAVASVTKPFTATAAMLLVERGLVGLDDPVQRYLPEFAGGGREQVTVRQLACHTAGLPEDLPPGTLRCEDRNGPAAILDALLRLPLRYPPGTRAAYSNVGPALLAEIVRRVDGRPLAELARAEIFAPLGLRSTFFDPPPSELPRLARVHGVTDHAGSDVEPYNSPCWRRLALPWGGLFSTPTDLVRFAAAFLPGGAGPLQPATAAEMIRDQTGGLPGGLTGALEWPHNAWGLGWEVRGEKWPHWSGRRASPRSFGHFGHSGALLWADPERDLAWAVCANQTMDSGWYRRRWPAFCDAVVAAFG